MNRRDFLRSSVSAGALLPASTLSSPPTPQEPTFLDYYWPFIESMKAEQWLRMLTGDFWIFFIPGTNRSRFFVNVPILQQHPAHKSAVKLMSIKEYSCPSDPWVVGHFIRVYEDKGNHRFPVVVSCSCGYVERCEDLIKGDELRSHHTRCMVGEASKDHALQVPFQT